MTVILVLALATVAMAADPFVGTWKLNLAKSKFNPGPPPRSLTRTCEDRGGGVIHVTFEGIDPQGNRIFQQWAAKYDGKDYPVQRLGAKTVISISIKATNAYTAEHIFKEDGKLTTTSTLTIPKNGKTMTINQKNRNAQGQQVNNIIVFDKQ